MKRVLVTEPIHDVGMDLLRSRPNVEVVEAPDINPETLAALMPGTHGVAVRLAEMTADLLALSNELQVVSRHGVGCDLVDVSYMTERGLPVAITAGANSTSVAELTMGMVISLARHLSAQDGDVRDGTFKAKGHRIAMDLEGAKMLVVGFGRIGRKMAPRARAFGMDVTVADIALDTELAAQMGCRGVEDFRAELSDADVVTFHVPLDSTTRHLMGAAEFEQIKEGAILINCARGGIVDETALLQALQSGRLLGAGLDVFSQEPPPLDDPVFGPLLAHPDVILTPHSGAASVGSLREMARMTAQNILDAFDGRLTEDCIFNLEGLNGR